LGVGTLEEARAARGEAAASSRDVATSGVPAIAPLKRGLAASEADAARVEALAAALERRNPTKKPLASDLLNGGWCLSTPVCVQCVCVVVGMVVVWLCVVCTRGRRRR
jgi:hypothetical protein